MDCWMYFFTSCQWEIPRLPRLIENLKNFKKKIPVKVVRWAAEQQEDEEKVLKPNTKESVPQSESLRFFRV